MGKPVKFSPQERLQFAQDRYIPLSPSIHESVVIEGSVQFGEGCEIHPNVVILGNVKIGDHCLIKSGAVIGDKGFSFEKDGDRLIRVAHTGGVVIGNHVEIGSNATVCQGTVDDTVIGDYSKIDDHVHVAHNVRIGKRCQIPAGVVLCGSTVIEDDCWIGVNACVRNKVVIHKGAYIGMGAVVLEDVPERAVMVGNPARVLRYA